MIYLITGKPRHGKGLYTFSKVDEIAKRENRQVYYVHIPECKFDWIELKDISEWPKLPHGAIIIVDEAHNYFPQEKVGARRPEYVQLLDQHAQFGYDFYIISQNPKGITTYLRDRVEEHWHLIRKFGRKVSTVYKFYDTQPVPLSATSKENAITETFRFPEKMFGMYRSAHMHNVKTAVPFRYYLLFILPVFIVALGWYGVSGLIDLTSDEPAEISEPSLEESIFGAPNKGRLVTAEAVDYYGVRAERVQGLPHTAPVYDEITKPVEAPLPAACVEIRGECTCYTQQATRLNTPPDICRQIVQKGYFVDFQNGEALQAEQRPDDMQRHDFSRVESDRTLEASNVQPRRGETVAPAPVGVPIALGDSPGQTEVRSPSKITRERMQASPWAFETPS